MNEFEKVIISIAIVVFLCAGCFGWGYLFCNTRATKQLEQANNELAAQQRKYDEIIRAAEERIRDSEEQLRQTNERLSNIRNELFGKISDNGEAARELSAIVEQIKKQRISV